MLRVTWKYKCREKVLQSFCCSLFHTNGAIGQNHYDTLGVSKTATQAEIKEAYFKLCKEYHPDKHSNNETKSNKFLKVNDAYNILNNSASRREYDATMLRARRPPLHSDRTYDHERWSSAYRGNPYVRNQRTDHRNWEDFYRHRETDFSHRQRYRDDMDRYWDEYYKHQRSWQNSRSSPPPQWTGQLDRITSFIVVFVVTLLMMRFMAAGIAMRSRQNMQETELQRHLEVRRHQDEAMERIKTYQDEQSELQNRDLIATSKLEDV